jgi:GntR family transcriptional repressor for pyruvate dehydrogenase complex
MAFEEIRKSTAPEMVVEQILKKLSTGELEPGSRLPSQRELAQFLGVGRSSVREATNALAVMGYLEVLQGKGTFIRRELPSTDVSITQLRAALEAGSIFDLMEARELLECKSVELAAERAGDKQIRQLEAVLKKFKESGEEYQDFLETDLELHYCLAETTGNAVICEMMKLVIEKVLKHHARMRTTLLSTGFRSYSKETATRVVESVIARNGADAAVWMKKHLNAIRGELKDVIS